MQVQCDSHRLFYWCLKRNVAQRKNKINSVSCLIVNRTVVDIAPRHTGQWELEAISVSIHCGQNVSCPHGIRATLTCGATRQTSHEAEANVTTALAAAVVLLLLVTGGCVLSSTSSNSYSSVELPVSSSTLNGLVTLSQQWLTEHKNSVAVQPPPEYRETAQLIHLSCGCLSGARC